MCYLAKGGQSQLCAARLETSSGLTSTSAKYNSELTFGWELCSHLNLR